MGEHLAYCGKAMAYQLIIDNGPCPVCRRHHTRAWGAWEDMVDRADKASHAVILGTDSATKVGGGT